MKNFIFILIFLTSTSTFSQNNIAHLNSLKDSADAIYSKIKASNKISDEDFQVARSLIYSLSDLAEFEIAESYLKKFQGLAISKGTKKNQALIYHAYGYFYKKKNDFDKALFYYHKSIELRKSIGDEEGMPPTYNNIANIYYDIGRYTESLLMHQNALAIRRKIKDVKGITKSLSGIGNILSDQNRYIEALKYYRESLLTSLKISDTIQISTNYVNIGEVKYILKEYDSAIYYFNKSLQFSIPINYSYITAYGFTGIGTTYLDKKELYKAKKYLDKGFVIRKQLETPLEITLSELEISRYYQLTGDYEKSIECAERSLKTSKIIGFLKGEQIASSLLADSYKNIGNYKRAFENLKKFKESSDSLFSIEEKMLINEKNNQLKIERKTNALEIAQTKKITTYVIIISIITILFVGSFIWFLRSRNLQKKQTEMLIKQKELEAEKEIIFSNQKIRKKISQDMHDDLGTSISGLRIYSEILMNKTDEELSKKEHFKLVNMANEVSQKVKDIVWTLDSENDTLDNLSWYCDRYIKNLMDYFPDIQVQTKMEIIPEIPVSGNFRKQIFLSVKELINNSLKHAKADKLQVRFSFQNNEYEIHLHDNGKGFDENEIPNSGNGLKNILSRMESINGKFEFKSNQKGTTNKLTVKIVQMGY